MDTWIDRKIHEHQMDLWMGILIDAMEDEFVDELDMLICGYKQIDSRIDK